MSKSNHPSNTLLLGIDLGTSRTMVMSNRNTKSTVHSVVGYPRDIIGVKLMGRSHVIGEEALQRQSYLDLHYPLEDGVLKEANDQAAEAAKLLIKHMISLAEPRPGDKICGVVGVPARASVFNKNQLLKITGELMSLSMVVSEPFMVAYELGKLNNAIIIDIGAGTTDICAMKGVIPGMEEQATVLKAGNYIDFVLENLIIDKYPNVQITKHLARKIKEDHAFVGDPEAEVEIELRINGKPQLCNLTQEIRVACETIVAEIIEHLQTLIMVFDPEDQAAALANVFLTGGGASIKGIEEMVMTQMKEYGDVQVKRVEDPDYSGSAGALKLASELPPAYWEQVGQVTGG